MNKINNLIVLNVRNIILSSNNDSKTEINYVFKNDGKCHSITKEFAKKLVN